MGDLKYFGYGFFGENFIYYQKSILIIVIVIVIELELECAKQ